MFGFGAGKALSEIVERLATIESAIAMLAERVTPAIPAEVDAGLDEGPEVEAVGPIVPSVPIPVAAKPSNRDTALRIRGTLQEATVQVVAQAGEREAATSSDRLRSLADELRGLHRELENVRSRRAA